MENSDNNNNEIINKNENVGDKERKKKINNKISKNNIHKNKATNEKKIKEVEALNLKNMKLFQ